MTLCFQASNQAALFFDAFMIYAKMLNETLAEGLDPLDGRALSRRMWNRTHAGGKDNRFDVQTD